MAEQFIFERIYFDAIKALPAAEQSEIYTAVLNYGFDKKLPNKITPISKAVFTLIKNDIKDENIDDETTNEIANQNTTSRIDTLYYSDTIIQDRIRHIINHYNLNVLAFSKKLGFPNNTTINNIVSGRKSKPSYDVLVNILTVFPEVNTDWLVLGKGEMLKDKEG